MQVVQLQAFNGLERQHLIFDFYVLQSQFFVVFKQYLEVLLVHVLFLLHLKLAAVIAGCDKVYERFDGVWLLVVLAFDHLLIESTQLEAYLGQKGAVVLVLLLYFLVDEVELFYLLLHGKHYGVHDLRDGAGLVAVVGLVLVDGLV